MNKKSGPQYTPKRDGTLEKYLESHNGISSFALFKGYNHYKLLWNREYLEPNISVIRLMWNFGRDDEHFLVLGEYEIQGLSDLPAHPGREGTFDPRRLLEERDCPYWEAHNLNPRPRKRK